MAARRPGRPARRATGRGSARPQSRLGFAGPGGPERVQVLRRDGGQAADRRPIRQVHGYFTDAALRSRDPRGPWPARSRMGRGWSSPIHWGRWSRTRCCAPPLRLPPFVVRVTRLAARAAAPGLRPAAARAAAHPARTRAACGPRGSGPGRDIADAGDVVALAEDLRPLSRRQASGRSACTTARTRTTWARTSPIR